MESIAPSFEFEYVGLLNSFWADRVSGVHWGSEVTDWVHSKSRTEYCPKYCHCMNKSKFVESDCSFLLYLDIIVGIYIIYVHYINCIIIYIQVIFCLLRKVRSYKNPETRILSIQSYEVISLKNKDAWGCTRLGKVVCAYSRLQCLRRDLRCKEQFIV